MKHSEIMAILKTYYAEVLERAKARMDAEGPLSGQVVSNIKRELGHLDDVILDGSDDLGELIGLLQAILTYVGILAGGPIGAYLYAAHKNGNSECKRDQ